MDIDAFRIDQTPGTAVGTYIEADDDGIGGDRQVDIRFTDATHHAMHHAHLHFLGRKFLERVGEGLDRTLDIGLHDQRQGLDVALLHLLEHVG